MLLYVIRHAIAHQHDPDAWPDDRARPLTRPGAKKMRRAARGLQRTVLPPDALLTSPLTRAQQTAEILHQEAGWPVPVACAALAPPGRPADVADALVPYTSAPGGSEPAIAVVGHEPGVSELASWLLAGEQAHAWLEFKKGAVACFQLEGTPEPGRATLLWLAPPRFLRALANHG